MINLTAFIKKCERDLITNQKRSEDTLAEVSSLLNRNQAFCEPILGLFEKLRNPVRIAERKQELEELLIKKTYQKRLNFYQKNGFCYVALFRLH